MSDFDFSKMTAEVTTRLREPRIPAVDAAIVRQAQRAVDGAEFSDGKPQKTYALTYTFPSPEIAVLFAKGMRNAGHHTNPKCSLSVVINPDNAIKRDKDGQPELDSAGKEQGTHKGLCTVSWQAGARRGAKPATAASDKPANNAAG